MDFLSENTIQQLWNLASNEDYSEIWDIIFADEGVIPEKDVMSNDDLLDELYEDFEL
jgi:hypothetical protein